MADSSSSYDSHANISTDHEVTLQRYGVIYDLWVWLRVISKISWNVQLRMIKARSCSFKHWFGGICVHIQRCYCQVLFHFGRGDRL